MPLRTRKSGFTLVEMLIVLVIVGILAAIVLPAFGRVRENGRRASCASNLRQIGLAMAQYAGDYDGTYAPAWRDQWAYGELRQWTDAEPRFTWDIGIAPYAGGASMRALVRCPNDDNVTEAKEMLQELGLDGSRRTYSLAAVGGMKIINAGDPSSLDMNLGFSGEEFVPDPNKQPEPGKTFLLGKPVTRREAQIAAPSTTLMVVEHPAAFNLAGAFDESVCFSNQGVQSPFQDEYGRNTPESIHAPLHSGGWNYLFCDGHVKWLRQEQTWGKGSPDEPRGMWTLDPND